MRSIRDHPRCPGRADCKEAPLSGRGASRRSRLVEEPEEPRRPDGVKVLCGLCDETISLKSVVKMKSRASSRGRPVHRGKFVRNV